MESNMPDYGFGRCDGHHEMVDFRLRAPDFSPESIKVRRKAEQPPRNGRRAAKKAPGVCRGFKVNGRKKHHLEG
jgi:hypothetical protein